MFDRRGYKINLTNGTSIDLDNPSKMPDLTTIKSIEEPYVKAEMMMPKDFIGTVMQLCQDRRGIYKNLEYFDGATGERYIPYVIEPSLGVERLFLAVLCEAYDEEVIDEVEDDIFKSEISDDDVEYIEEYEGKETPDTWQPRLSVSV